MAVLKTDSRGRVRTPPQQREALLDAFDHSGMSGAAFARLHGIRYPTFASWRQTRNRQRQPAPEFAEAHPFFEEVTLSGFGNEGAGLRLALPGGASVTIDRADQFPLVAALLKYLEQVC